MSTIKTKVKYTPGPWYSRQQGSEIEIKAGLYTICMVHNYNEPHEVNEANAKLIEAAPELFKALKTTLAALKDVVRQLPTDESLADYRLDFAEAAEFEAIAAIKKASK